MCGRTASKKRVFLPAWQTVLVAEDGVFAPGSLKVSCRDLSAAMHALSVRKSINLVSIIAQAAIVLVCSQHKSSSLDLVMLCLALLTVGAACCRSFTTSDSKKFTRVLEAVACDNPAGPFLIAVPLLLNVAWLLLGGFLGRQYGALPFTVLSSSAEAMAAMAKVRPQSPVCPAQWQLLC